jgi:hypothetical protein
VLAEGKKSNNTNISSPPLQQIWSLDGQVVQVLDRSKVVPLCSPGSTRASDPSAAIPSPEDEAKDGEACRTSPQASAGGASRYNRSYMWNQASSEICTVRDVSWHSSEPAMMSTAWDGPDGQHGSIAKHVSGKQMRRLLCKTLTALHLFCFRLQEWKGFGRNGLNFEDALEKTIAEASR